MSVSNRFGLIGYPLTHSFSKRYFTEKFEKEGLSKDFQYDLFPIENASDFKNIIVLHPELKGINVTIPHKESVMPLLDEIDESASTIGAVNTIKIERGKTKGYNTDVIGFKQSLQTFLGGVLIKQALILGTGGAGKAVAYVLQQMNISFEWVSRGSAKGVLKYPSLKGRLNDFQLIINTTPLGTFPNVDACPDIPYQELTNQHFLFDLVYNPTTTTFMDKGLKANCKVINGLEMLHLQADSAWEIWNS
ncbi:MAG: shikimate dehydrogenase family protein [Saprospiraceae bacterium]